MVLFVDLDEEIEPPEIRRSDGLQTIGKKAWLQNGTPARSDIPEAMATSPDAAGSGERTNPNRNALTEALGCYPVISEIASQIDLNTLDNLSRTCRQVRENLLQFRVQLISKTLRCCNEDVIPNGEHTLRYRARAADWYFVEEGATSGKALDKVGSCARDMVSECRRCGRVVCRNCTIKPPAPILLRHRHRRLCPTCIRASLPSLITPHLSAPSDPTSSSLPASTTRRSVCTCTGEGVWLCQPCGRGLRGADTTYESIWRWRSTYGAKLGGLGTGIGEGDRSSECGRATQCLAARQVQEEIDCDAEDAKESEVSRINDAVVLAALGHHNSNGRPDEVTRVASPFGTNEFAAGSGSLQTGPGYARHEIEGIGGVVKKKLVRMVWVGACVMEWEDEKEQGRYLTREVEGKTRSWCGWCWRVIPGANDKVE